MATPLFIDSGNFVAIMAFDGGGLTAGEATIFTFALPGVTPTATLSSLPNDATWAFHAAANIVQGAAPNQRLNAYVVPAGKTLYVTNINIAFIDVGWPSVHAFLDHEEPTDGRYGHGIKWTARVNGAAVQPWADYRGPMGGRFGYVNPARDIVPSERLQQYLILGDRVWIEVPSGSYFTLSAYRATDPRTNDIYAGAGTKLHTRLGYGSTNLSILEHHMRIRGIYCDAGTHLDFDHLVTLDEDQYFASPTQPVVPRPAP